MVIKSPAGSSLFPDFSDAFLRRLSLFHFKPRPGIPGKGAGEHLVRKGGASVEFSDYRTYSFGDDFRIVDWNSFARLDKMFVKVFRDEEGFVLHLLLDCSRSMDWGTPNKFLFARRLSAAIGYVALSGYNWVTLQSLPSTYTFPEKRGRAMIPLFFRFLDNISSQGPCELNRAFDEYARKNPRPGLLFILSDAMSPLGVEGGVKRLLSLGYQVVFLHIVAPEEMEPKWSGDFELEDLEWGNKVDVSLDPFSRRTFRLAFERWRQNLRDFCAAHQVPYLCLPSSLKVEEVMLRLLPKGGIIH